MFELEDDLQNEIFEEHKKFKDLEAKVLAWRQKLKKDLDIFEHLPYKRAPEYLDEFDEYFGIITETEGKLK